MTLRIDRSSSQTYFRICFVSILNTRHNSKSAHVAEDLVTVIETMMSVSDDIALSNTPEYI